MILGYYDVLLFSFFFLIVLGNVKSIDEVLIRKFIVTTT